MVHMLLKYNVPLADALLRAVDMNFMDAVQEICRYAKEHPVSISIIFCCLYIYIYGLENVLDMNG